MARVAKTLQPFTVRNHLGQYLGTYRAFTAEQAVQKHLDSQNTYAATFRHRESEQPRPTAQVE